MSKFVGLFFLKLYLLNIRINNRYPLVGASTLLCWIPAIRGNLGSQVWKESEVMNDNEFYLVMIIIILSLIANIKEKRR